VAYQVLERTLRLLVRDVLVHLPPLSEISSAGQRTAQLFSSTTDIRHPRYLSLLEQLQTLFKNLTRGVHSLSAADFRDDHGFSAGLHGFLSDQRIALDPTIAGKKRLGKSIEKWMRYDPTKVCGHICCIDFILPESLRGGLKKMPIPRKSSMFHDPPSMIQAVRHGHGSSVDTFGAICIHIRAISVSMHGYTDLSTDYPRISTHHPQTSKILNFCMFLRSF
jgi:hypothetical protein